MIILPDDSLGRKIFYPRKHKAFIIEATIVGLENVWHNGDAKSPSVWEYIHRNLPTRIGFLGVDDKGEYTFETKTKQELIDGGYYICNQFIAIDEPVGHSLTLGDELFFNLKDARNVIPPGTKRHLRRRYQAMQKRVVFFIAKTHGMTREEYEESYKYEYPVNRLYVRKS